MWLQSDKIALDRGGNYDNEELVIATSGIDRVELRNLSDGKVDAILLLSIAVAVLGATYLALRGYGMGY